MEKDQQRRNNKSKSRDKWRKKNNVVVSSWAGLQDCQIWREKRMRIGTLI